MVDALLRQRRAFVRAQLRGEVGGGGSRFGVIAGDLEATFGTAATYGRCIYGKKSPPPTSEVRGGGTGGGGGKGGRLLADYRSMSHRDRRRHTSG